MLRWSLASLVALASLSIAGLFLVHHDGRALGDTARPYRLLVPMLASDPAPPPSLPDLVLLAGAQPDYVGVGNHGTAALDGRNVRTQAWLSSDATLDASDCLAVDRTLGDWFSSNGGSSSAGLQPIPTGASYISTPFVGVTVPACIADPALHYFIYVVDPDNAVAESNETNNTIAVPK